MIATFALASFTRLVAIKKTKFNKARKSEKKIIDAITNLPSNQVVTAVTAKNTHTMTVMSSVKIADFS